MVDSIIIPKIIVPKPVVSWWKSSDPCLYINKWRNSLTEINIIETKRLSDEFIQICLYEKSRIFLHVNITGMGQTVFEPNIPTVKETFKQIQKLIELGFPQKQILVCVKPILPNENGLNALKLLLKVFTEFKMLRLRFVRFNVLAYFQIENGKYVVSNKNVTSRDSTKKIMPWLSRSQTFWKDYYKLIDNYQSIICVDKGDEAIIGIRELIVFGYKNEWITADGVREKIIDYEKGNKYKPILNILSDSNPTRCKNRCLLCPWRY